MHVEAKTVHEKGVQNISKSIRTTLSSKHVKNKLCTEIRCQNDMQYGEKLATASLHDLNINEDNAVEVPDT